ncbi:MAG: sulfite exporter TauE/SafE family protein [Thermoanaerobaculales bacterium]|nr:sulfite exporter TauE/SafE family protein [Thermoanaerobaculales bacterium]
MEFSISGVTVAPWVPPLAAFVISFFTSMGGVSGAFLLLPFQMSLLGYTAPSVSATNHLFNVVAIPSGVWRYIREGRMVWPLTWVVVIATLPGVFIGAVVRVRYLPDPARFKLFAAAVLLYIGFRMLRELISSRSKAKVGSSAEERFQQLVTTRSEEGSDLPKVRLLRFSLGRIEYSFYGERYGFSTPGISALAFAVGVAGGIYGIGGGAIMAPFFVSVFGLPIYTVAGAALMGTLVTSVAGVVFMVLIGVGPDWLLGLLFGLGGAAGMYCGARLQKFVPARAIKVMLCLVIVATAVRYVIGFFS